MARYNHVYEFVFSLDSEAPDGSDVTASMLRTALHAALLGCEEQPGPMQDDELIDRCARSEDETEERD